MRSVARAILAALACAGLAGCVPDDFSYGSSGSGGMRECDTDECAKPICAAGEHATDAGACVPTCPAIWSSELTGWMAGSLLVEPDDTALLVAGATSADGREPTAAVSSIDGCEGAVDTLLPVATQQPSKAAGIASLGDALIVAGSEHLASPPSSAFVVTLDREPLRFSASLPIAASGGGESLLDVTTSADRAWSVGQSEIATNARAFAVVSRVDQSSCSFEFGVSPGRASSVLASAGGVLVAGENAGSIVLWRFDDGACSPPACECAPEQTSAPLLPEGAASAQVADLVLLGSVAYVAGSALKADTTAFGFVLAIDAESLALGGSALIAPSSGNHGVLALATDGVRMFAAGAYGMQAPGALETGTGFVAELPLPLGPAAAPLWLQVVAGTPAVTALGCDPSADGALFVGTLGGLGIGRCTKQGICGGVQTLPASGPS